MTEDELDLFAGQLDVILGSVARIREVAAADIEPTSHAVPLQNVLRPDVVPPSLPREDVLAGRPGGRGRPVPGTADPGRGGVMAELYELDAAATAAAIAAGDTSAVEVASAHLDRIAGSTAQVQAFLHVDTEGALAAARAVDERRAAGDELGPLAGVPLAMKDVVVTKGLPTTSGSKILQGWIPPYDATITRRVIDAGIVMLGKTNMDEFAMGSSTENSAYQMTRNPWDLSRVPGGSSGGSSAAVAAFEAPLAIGTDTGGSIRQPAAVTGIVGHKPTYGAVSRYGLIAFSSSPRPGRPVRAHRARHRPAARGAWPVTTRPTRPPSRSRVRTWSPPRARAPPAT